MQAYTMEDAQAHLDDLLEAALAGKTVFIQLNDQMVQLVPFTMPKKVRKAGSARQKIQLADDFDAPLSDFSKYSE